MRKTAKLNVLRDYLGFLYENKQLINEESSNGVDMLKHKSTANYKTWGKKEYVKLAKDNPIKFLKQSASDFFENKEGYEIALAKELESVIS